MHEVLINRLGGLSLPRKSEVRLTDRPDMTLDAYRGPTTTKAQRIRYAISVNMQFNKVCIVWVVLSVPFPKVFYEN